MKIKSFANLITKVFFSKQLIRKQLTLKYQGVAWNSTEESFFYKKYMN